MSNPLPNYLFRAFHENSGARYINGGFIASATHNSFCKEELENHFKWPSRIPTPWISTTSSLLHALKRAINLSVRGNTGVYIAIIDTEQCDGNRPYYAKDLAAEMGVEIKPWNENEWLFDRTLQPRSLCASLSLDTVIDRGLLRDVPVLDPESEHYSSSDVFLATTVPKLLDLLQESCDVPFVGFEDPDENDEGPNVAPGCYGIGIKAAQIAECFGIHNHTPDIAAMVVQWWCTALCPSATLAIEDKMEKWRFWKDVEKDEKRDLQIALERKRELIEAGEKLKAKRKYRELVRKARGRRNRRTRCFEGNAGVLVWQEEALVEEE